MAIGIKRFLQIESQYRKVPIKKKNLFEAVSDATVLALQHRHDAIIYMVTTDMSGQIVNKYKVAIIKGHRFLPDGEIKKISRFSKGKWKNPRKG